MFKIWLVLLLLVGLLAYWGIEKSAHQINMPKDEEAPLVEADLLLESLPEVGEVAGVNQSSIGEINNNLFLVVRVIDGDTIELVSGERVRYIGVNTPETVHPDKAAECYGQEASKFNKQLIEGKWVRLDKDISETDKYGRLLRYVYLDDQMVNLLLVQNGYAEASTYPPDVKFTDEFLEAQTLARNDGKGLWSACGPQGLTITESDGCNIKGNISLGGEKIFHLPTCEYYNQTVITESKGERWFCSASEAAAAGWWQAQNCSLN